MPFDLDKLIKERPKTGARKKKFSFTFDGTEFVLPNEVDMLAVRAAAQYDFVTALQRVLTPEQYALIVASTTMLTQESLGELLHAYFSHLTGLSDPGKSSGSANSSKSTPKPSKRTSKRAIKSVSLR